MNGSIFLLLFLLITICTCSQDISEDTLKVEGNFNLSASIISGSEFQRTFKVELNPNIEKKSWSLQNEFRFLYNDTDNEVLNRNWDALSKYKVFLQAQKKWYPFLVVDLQTNLGYELELRLGSGGGLTYQPKAVKNNSWLFSIASVYYINRYTETIFINSDRIGNQRNMLRMVLHYAHSAHIIKDKFILKSNGWFLQSTRESSDYIFKFYISFALKVTKALSLTADYRFNYENVTLESLDSNQQFTSIGVTADF